MFFHTRFSIGLVMSLAVACSAAAVDIAAPAAQAQVTAPAWRTLQPGGTREINQTLNVNVVFVGFNPGSIQQDRLVQALPKTSTNLVRSLWGFGINQPTGNRFSFRYKVVIAPPAYADRLFDHLGSLAVKKPRTYYQDFYNDAGVGTVKVGENYWIDGGKAEQWLAEHPPAEVDTHTHTVYMLNWYGRRDFRFHVYTKTDDPDPATGINQGSLKNYTKIAAWGGSPTKEGPPRRVWFYDFSAGPEGWGGSHDLATSDIDGDGLPDYRIPAIWDYGNPRGMRPFNQGDRI